MIRILTELGYSPSLGIQGNHGNINVYRKELASELGQYKKPWGVPVIPEFVWRGDREIRAAFLAGLSDADGTPSRNVLVNSNKLEFLREVQRLALSLGIATTLHERQPKQLKGRDTIYEGCHWIHIQGLQSQMVAFSLINYFAVRSEFTIRRGQEKWSFPALSVCPNCLRSRLENTSKDPSFTTYCCSKGARLSGC